jgi:hypothetical protein
MGLEFSSACIEKPILEKDFALIQKLLNAKIIINEDIVCFIIKNDDIEMFRTVIKSCKITTSRPINCAIIEKNDKITKMLYKMSAPFDDRTIELAKINNNLQIANYLEEKMTSKSSYP